MAACPCCAEFGRDGKLILRQINATQALYVCCNPKCPYPVGLTDKVVQSVVPEFQEKQQQDVAVAADSSHSPQSSKNDPEPSETFEPIFDPELDALLSSLLAN